MLKTSTPPTPPTMTSSKASSWLKRSSIYICFSPEMSCCLLRTGCSTRRPTLCPSCTWATSPCPAARPSGRADAPGGRSPPHSPLFYTPPSLWKTAAASAKERRELYPPTTVSSWTVNHGTSVNGGDRTLFIYVSHIFSEGQTAGLIMCVSLLWPLVWHTQYTHLRT